MLTDAMFKTWVEIDEDVLRANIRHIQTAIGPTRSLIIVVKSDAYGHGAQTVASIAEEEGVAHLAVATIAEGVELRDAGIDCEILLLHPPLSFEVADCIHARLSPTVSSLANAKLISDESNGTPVGVHVELNTGINRLGIDWQTAASDIQHIEALPNISLAGTFTHFRGIDPSDSASIDTQLDRFERVIREMKMAGHNPGLVHAASSHALARFQNTHLDAVRPGMMIYAGVPPSPRDGTTQPEIVSPLTDLSGVMSVRSRVLHTRGVDVGEWIHYGETYQAVQPMTIAVVPIGYGMGYSRHLGNRADMLVNGQRAPIVGVIGMDMTAIDTSQIPGVKVGDVVTVLGIDGNESISAFDLADQSGTIAYEVVCRLGNGLPRLTVHGRQAATSARDLTDSSTSPARVTT